MLTSEASMNAEVEVGPAAARFPQPGGSRISRVLADLLVLVTCILAFMFAVDVCVVMVTGRGSEYRDFVSYWASGQLLVHHQNPYDADAILHLEQSRGFPVGQQALIVRNPPSALLLVAPLGFLSFRAATLLWSVLLVGCWMGSAWMLWVMLGRPTGRFRLLRFTFPPGFVPLIFAPALMCVLAGQTGLFALFGLVLFLRLHRSQPFLAGASLWLCALKPHLFLPFAAVLLLWVVVTRSYRVVVGAVLALATSSFVALRADPSAWVQYTQMMRTIGIEREFIPCISIALRFAINRNAIWLQYLPALVGCVWAVWYYWKRRALWDWVEHGPLLVLVSMLVSPYAWLTDQVLALPALLQAVYRTSLKCVVPLALAGCVIEIGVLCRIYMHSAFYLWTAPAWLAWVLYVQRRPAHADSASQ
jgi:hypothetical protein